jgi:hypothetical protein
MTSNDKHLPLTGKHPPYMDAGISAFLERNFEVNETMADAIRELCG